VCLSIVILAGTGGELLAAHAMKQSARLQVIRGSAVGTLLQRAFGLGAMWVGVPFAPISTNGGLITRSVVGVSMSLLSFWVHRKPRASTTTGLSSLFVSVTAIDALRLNETPAAVED